MRPGRMGDQLAREQVDPWVALQRTISQLRQLEVILARQVLADVPDLVLDDVVVVAQPFLGSDRLRVATGRRREEQVGRIERRRTRVEPRQQRCGRGEDSARPRACPAI